MTLGLPLLLGLPHRLTCFRCCLVKIHALTRSDGIQDLPQGVVLHPLPPELLLEGFVFHAHEDQVEELVILPGGATPGGVVLLVAPAPVVAAECSLSPDPGLKAVDTLY